MTLDSQLDKLAALPADWNGYGENPITPEAIATCRSIHFSPCSDGGVQIDLWRHGVLVEVTVSPEGRITACGFDVDAKPNLVVTQEADTDAN